MERRGFLATAAGALVVSAAAPAYTPTKVNLESRAWFQDAKFGLFVHWGVYSVLGNGEWVMENTKIPIVEYEKLPARFNPTAFHAAEWVAMAKNAGMRYITITSKHHDGFAMFATKQNRWNIVDATPWKQDPLKMLADECRRQGLKLFFYYSQLDWHHPDYYPLGRTGKTAGRAAGGDFNRYLDFMDAQLTELLTNYGDIGGIWFDGWWDKPDAEWRLERTYSLIHRLQPAAMVGSNHHRKPFDGEDFQMFEKDLPGGRTQSYNAEVEIGALPLETCETINGAWGYNQNDKRFKSTKDLIHYLVRAAGHNANFLLNVGPMPDGRIQPEFVSRLAEMGRWLQANGESIYGTRGGPFPPRNWGAVTQKGNRLYVHVLDWSDPLLAMPRLPRIKSAALLKDGRKVTVRDVGPGTVLELPAGEMDPIDTVVVLEKAA
ncbi:MAG: alpha-L-fucosidase [Bryobacterales bacterium]|nr:alpha-L-fucosidase [Bryobacterales bacterium]